jgi:hypothetical protein
VKEIVRNQLTGLHFAPGDSEIWLRRWGGLLNNPLEDAATGGEARRQYGHYTAERKQMLMQICEKTLQSRGVRRSRSLGANGLNCSQEFGRAAFRGEQKFTTQTQRAILLPPNSLGTLPVICPCSSTCRISPTFFTFQLTNPQLQLHRCSDRLIL